jgi:sugar transferase (PEP-CTERM system associated)
LIRLFQHYVSSHLLSQMARDFVAFWGINALALSAVWHLREIRLDALAIGAVLAVATALVGFTAGLYQRAPAASPAAVFAPAALTWTLYAPMAFIAVVLMRPYIPGVPAALMVMISVTGMVLARRARELQRQPVATRLNRVLIVGAGEVAQLVSRTMRQNDRHSTIVGYFPCAAETRPLPLGNAPVLMGMPLIEAATRVGATEIVVALTERRGGGISLDDLLACRARGIPIIDTTAYFERSMGQIRLDHVRPGFLVFGDGFDQGPVRSAVKRVFDIGMSSLLFALSLPVLLMAMLAIKLDSRGPIFYSQDRIGAGGRAFSVLKLRSMRVDAEEPGKPQFAKRVDSRVTRVGRFIRLVRIDELPQLLNVMRGEMSLVGPRPERGAFVEQLMEKVPYYGLRHSVKPGLTGWAQVRYQYGSSLDDAKEKLQFDLYYVKNHTLFLDTLILLKTVGVVLTGKGAR